MSIITCSLCRSRRGDTAAHLVDRVFPLDVAARQWVLSLPFRVRWIDERRDEFRDVRADNVEIVVSARSDDEVRRAPPQAAYVVLTHSHSLDSAIVAAVLERGDFTYCGLIGSLTKRRVFERAFRDTGIPEATIARLTCPIGDRGVDDKRPEIIAALAAAELIEVFAGRSSR